MRKKIIRYTYYVSVSVLLFVFLFSVSPDNNHSKINELELVLNNPQYVYWDDSRELTTIPDFHEAVGFRVDPETGGFYQKNFASGNSLLLKFPRGGYPEEIFVDVINKRKEEIQALAGLSADLVLLSDLAVDMRSVPKTFIDRELGKYPVFKKPIEASFVFNAASVEEERMIRFSGKIYRYDPIKKKWIALSEQKIIIGPNHLFLTGTVNEFGTLAVFVNKNFPANELRIQLEDARKSLQKILDRMKSQNKKTASVAE